MTQKEEILNATNGGWDIFRHLIPSMPDKPGKMFKSVLKDEKNPSAHVVKLNGNEHWTYKDFSEGSGVNIFDFIMKVKGVAFEEAIALAAEYSNIPALPKRKAKEPEEIVLYPSDELINQVTSRLDTEFHKFCLILGITEDHLAKWMVGGSDKGLTAFIYTKDDQTPVNIKFIAYQPNGKRNKDVKPYSLTSTAKGEVYKMCLFGEHLLNGDRSVCIVESEKTAVIASFFYPEYDWLATGGVFGAKKLDYLRNGLADGRQCLVVLDADPIRKTPKALDILLAIGAKAETVDLFPDRTDSTDIADYIVEGLHPEIVKDRVKVFWKKNKQDVLDVMPVRIPLFSRRQIRNPVHLHISSKHSLPD